MISKKSIRPVAVGLAVASTLFAVQHLFGEVPARWYGGALILIGLADVLRNFSYVSRSGYWVTRGACSETGEPCWLVKGGPFSGEDDTVAELGTWREARAYVRRGERLMTEAYNRDRTRG